MPVLPGEATYVYLVRAEFDGRASVEDWNRWYDERHVPDLLTVPGFIGAARFQDLSNPLVYLATYELESAAAFGEERYRAVTGWGEWAPHIVWQRGLYRSVDLSDPTRPDGI